MRENGAPDPKRGRWEDCPRELSLPTEVRARAAEISDLLAAMDNPTLPKGEVTHGPRTFLQRLPRHMRRRAMSHNIKRLPRSRRVPLAQEQIAMSKHKAKPPSRYHRRRPRNLLQAYVRRQRRSAWLETHIWHAKRFHFDREAWGYQLPSRSTQRGFRAAFRDATRHCVVQDVSFLVCLELRGPLDQLLPPLSRLTSPLLGPTFAFKHAMGSGREQDVWVYRPDQYPYDCVGPVSFHWQPPSSKETQRRLWIWAHPSIWSELRDALTAVFGLSKTGPTTKAASPSPSPSPEMKKLRDWQAGRCELGRESWVGAGVELAVLKDSFVRLRLTGPLALPVLQAALRPPPPSASSHLYAPAFLATAATLWSELNSQSQSMPIPPHSVLPIVFADPRLHRPATKVKPIGTANAGGSRDSLNVSESLAESPFWNDLDRAKMSESRLADHVLNDRRQKQRSGLNFLVGDDTAKVLPFEDGVDSAVGGLLVYRGSVDRMVEVDVVAPSGWGMPLWLALQYATARAVGLSAVAHLDLERGLPQFPGDAADASAGRLAAAASESADRERWLRRPHNRRPDFARLHSPAPFRAPWAALAGQEPIPQQFYVLRERAALRCLRDWLAGNTAKDPADILKTHTNALIAVTLTATHGGVPKRLAMICSPLEGDVETAKTQKKSGIALRETVATRKQDGGREEAPDAADDGLSEEVSLVAEKEIPFDVLIPDTAGERSARRLLKRRSLRKAARVRRQEKRHGVTRAPASAAQLLPPSAELSTVCERGIVGFLCRGDQGLARGKGGGVGYVSFRRLFEAQADTLPKDRASLLFRNPTSTLYRMARLKII